MSNNVKIKFNETNLKRTISNNTLHFSCPNCGNQLETKLNQSTVTCYNCGKIINYNPNDLVNDITNAFKKGFK